MVEEKEEEIEIEEESSSSYGSKEKGRKEIMMNHIERCMQEGSKEMTEGGVTKRLINGRVEEFAVPNQREIFINCIKMLWSALLWDISNKYKEDAVKELGDWSGRMAKYKLEVEDYMKELREKEKKGYNVMHQVKFNNDSLAQQKLDLYMEKLDFCYYILNKENWFGPRMG